MKVTIYQINNIRDCNYSFMPWKFASKTFNLKDYKEVFSCERDSEYRDMLALEKIFREFNRVTKEDVDHLSEIDFKGHSLSTSDVVALDDKLYYCDSFGWQLI